MIKLFERLFQKDVFIFFNFLSMSYQEFTEKMKEFQNQFLAYIENEDNSEENYQNLISFFNEQKFGNNKDEIKLLLYMISNISKNHFRVHNFSYKVEQILLF